MFNFHKSNAGHKAIFSLSFKKTPYSNNERNCFLFMEFQITGK